MIIDVECPTCNGLGEVTGSTPSIRSRYVGRDDLNPDDYAEPCPRCGGSGMVAHDLNEDADDEDGEW